jgi:hypothetical protein
MGYWISCSAGHRTGGTDRSRQGRQFQAESSDGPPTMSMRLIKSAALAGASLTLTLMVVTACGEKSSEQSGAGGAIGTSGFAGLGAAGGAGTGAVGMGGANPGNGGAPFTPPPTDAGACRTLDESCERTTDCCGGLLCNRNGPIPSMNGCKTPCTQSSECPSGCCYLFLGGSSGGMCAEKEWCMCGTTGTQCSSALPPCCGTHQCQGGVCNQKCTQGSECASQCCLPVPLLPNTNTCVDRMYCP